MTAPLTAGLMILALCCLAYVFALPAPFFCLDDFAFIRFVHSANEKGPQILWTIFATPVYEIQPFLKCYRPLPDVAFLLEYFAFGLNPALYRVTNLLMHFGCAMLTYALGTKLFSSTNMQSPRTVAFIAAALFAVLPVTAEAVYTPTNIIVILCAITFLAGVQAFLQGRQILALILFIAALLSKEQAAALPAVLLLLSTCFQQKPMRESLIRTAPFWLCLIPYLWIRFAVLGDLVGGYHGWAAEALASNWQVRLFGPWPLTCLFPLNPNVWTKPQVIEVLLSTAYFLIALLVSSQASDWTRQPKAKLLTALCGWCVLCFVPTVSAFAISDTLLGGRHLYLCAPPFLLAASMCAFNPNLRKLSLSAATLTVALFVTINAINNLTYANACKHILSFKNKVETQAMASSDKMVIVNAPKVVAGSLTLSSHPMFEALFSPPFVASSVADRVAFARKWVHPYDNSFDARQLASVITSNDCKLFLWNQPEERLEPFKVDFGNGNLHRTCTAVNQHFDQTSQLSELTFACDPAEVSGRAAILRFTLRSSPINRQDGIAPAVCLRFEPCGQTLATAIVADNKPHSYQFNLNQSLEEIQNRKADTFKLLLPSPGFANEATDVELIGWRRAAQ